MICDSGTKQKKKKKKILFLQYNSHHYEAISTQMSRLRTFSEIIVNMDDKLLESEFTVPIHSDSDYSKYIYVEVTKKEDEREKED